MLSLQARPLALALLLCGSCLVLPARPAGAEVAGKTSSAYRRAVAGFSSRQAQTLVGEQSRAVVRALQLNDTRTLARYVHPVRGVRFSPYVYVESEHPTFGRSQVLYLAHHPRKFDWGTQDGTGDPIRLNWNAFRLRHLVPRPFLPQGPRTQENFNWLFQNGNALNNLDAAYPAAIIVRYYLPGTEKYGEMDWRALYLAWRPIGKTWYLVGIVGDQWTI